MTDIFETYIGQISLFWLALLSNCKRDSNMSHSIPSCTRNWYPLMISLPWNAIDIMWNVSPFEFFYVRLFLWFWITRRGLLFMLLYHVLWVNKHLLNLNLKIVWWYDEGNIVKKAWWSDGWMDRRNEPIHRAAWPQLKNVKLNRGLPVDTRRSFSCALLWYPGGQELGYLILMLDIKSY